MKLMFPIGWKLYRSQVYCPKKRAIINVYYKPPDYSYDCFHYNAGKIASLQIFLDTEGKRQLTRNLVQEVLKQTLTSFSDVKFSLMIDNYALKGTPLVVTRYPKHIYSLNLIDYQNLITKQRTFQVSSPRISP